MGEIRVLVGTSKGAFVLTADEGRAEWRVDGPLFGGWEVYHLVGSPADPDRLYASLSKGWFGQVVQRSDDGGRSWQSAGNDLRYEGEPGTHQHFDGSAQPWRFTRIWQLVPDHADPDSVLAGVEDAALFRTTDGAMTWRELPALRSHPTAAGWAPGAGGLCLHTILADSGDNQRLLVAISSAGVLASEDGGTSWELATTGLRSDFLPDPEAEVGHCVHKLARHPGRPDRVYMQKHWDVLRSDDHGYSWHEISGDLPTDFGFAIAVHAHDPDTVYVVPITSDELHFPPDGRLRVYRSRTAGGRWEPLTAGLPQRDCYVNVLRDGLAVDTLDPCGVYLGTTGGQVYVSADEGEQWHTIVRDLPRVLSVEVQTLP